MSITVTEKADRAVKCNICEHQTGVEAKEIYVLLRTLGGGCSGLQDRLDLDQEYKPEKDELFEFHGIPVVVDKRSLLYLQGVTVDFHQELHRSGFSISNPNRKSTCGCGS